MNQVSWWPFTVGRVCTKRIQFQRWSTHRIILAPKILISPPHFKISFGAIVLLWPRPDYSIRCNFTNKMARQETVGFINSPSDSVSGDAEGPEFIRCVDWWDPHIHEVRHFGKDGVTCEVDPTRRVDVGNGFLEDFATNYLTASWRRVAVFISNSINGCVEWLGVPDFISTNEPAWNANLLDPHDIWVNGVSTTNPNWGSKYWGASGSVFFPWNSPVRVLLFYHRRISENTSADARSVCDNLLRASRLARMQSLTTFRNPIRNPQVNRRKMSEMISRDELVYP